MFYFYPLPDYALKFETKTKKTPHEKRNFIYCCCSMQTVLMKSQSQKSAMISYELIHFNFMGY